MAESMNFEEFCRRYSTERACAEALFRLRWPGGFRCPKCGHARCYPIRTRRLPLFECASCRYQASVTAGTVMEGSRTPLTRWFQAIFLLSTPEGISSMQLSRKLRVSYKTAWLISHKIRRAMQKADQARTLNGIVRIDHSSYGYFFFPDARQPLLIGASLDQRSSPLDVKIKQPLPLHVRNETRRILPEGVKAFVRNFVKEGAHVNLPKYGSNHPELKKLTWEMNNWLNDTFCGIGAKHLQAYLDEFCFRINCGLRRQSALETLLQKCSETKALTYRKLILYKPILPVPWLQWESRNKWKGRHLVLWNT